MGCELDWNSAEPQTIHATYLSDNFEYASLHPHGCQQTLYPSAPEPTTTSYGAFRLRLSTFETPSLVELEIIATGRLAPVGNEQKGFRFLLETVVVTEDRSAPPSKDRSLADRQ